MGDPPWLLSLPFRGCFYYSRNFIRIYLGFYTLGVLGSAQAAGSRAEPRPRW